MNSIQNKFPRFLLVFCFLFLTGCVRITEVSKAMWGSSTKALEDARPQAAVKTYQCNLVDCFDKALEVAKNKKLTVFIADRTKDLIVLMKIPGSVNTTEVGVFFSSMEAEKTKLEIVSLSPKAQYSTADIVFTGLQEIFTEIK